VLTLKINQAFVLSVQAGDGVAGLFCRGKIFNASGGAVLDTVSLIHLENGLYLGSYTPTATGVQHVQYEFFTDAGFTLPAPYDLAAEDLVVFTNDVDDLATTLTSMTATLATLATSAALTVVATVVAFSRKILSNRQKVDESLKQQIVYDDDETTPILTFDLKDKFGTSTAGNMNPTDVHERVPV
jgi:hypothetical protein